MTAVTDESMRFLAERRSFPLPVPPAMHNHGNYIVSLSELVRWLGRRAEELGVDVYPGFGGRTLVFDDAKTRVIGVATNDVGIDRHGHPKVHIVHSLLYLSPLASDRAISSEDWSCGGGRFCWRRAATDR